VRIVMWVWSRLSRDGRDDRHPRPRARASEELECLFLGQVRQQVERDQHVHLAIEDGFLCSRFDDERPGRHVGLRDGPGTVIDPPAFLAGFVQAADQKPLGAAHVQKRARLRKELHQIARRLAEQSRECLP
jgi:hypothetical protein